MAITQQQNRDQIRPGEVVLTNRIRMNHPASHRDSLPETDLALVDLICGAAQVAFLDIDTARDWCRKHIMAEMQKWDGQEQAIAMARLGSLWKGGKN